MDLKTEDELADIVDEYYGNNAIGSEFPNVLDKVVQEGGYTERAKIEAVKKKVVEILKEIRPRRAS